MAVPRWPSAAVRPVWLRAVLQAGADCAGATPSVARPRWGTAACACRLGISRIGGSEHSRARVRERGRLGLHEPADRRTKGPRGLTWHERPRCGWAAADGDCGHADTSDRCPAPTWHATPGRTRPSRWSSRRSRRVPGTVVVRRPWLVVELRPRLDPVRWSASRAGLGCVARKADVLEHPPHHPLADDLRDGLHPSAAPVAGQDEDREHSVHQLVPSKAARRDALGYAAGRREGADHRAFYRSDIGLARRRTTPVLRHVPPRGRVGCQTSRTAYHVRARWWSQRGQIAHEVDRIELDRKRAVTPDPL